VSEGEFAFKLRRTGVFGSDIEYCSKNPERSGRADISSQGTELSTVGDAKEGK
jgi:hypothetical protein